MGKRKISYSIKVNCEDEHVIDFIRLNNPKGFDFEKIETIGGLTEKEKEFLDQILRERFDRTESKLQFKEDSEMIINICNKLNIDTSTNGNFMESDFMCIFNEKPSKI